MVKNKEHIDPSFWRNKNVLVTGHNGFKGSWLTLWLLSLGANVYGYSLPCLTDKALFKDLIANGMNQKNLPGLLEDNNGNINNLDKLKEYISTVNPDIVFHLAAQPLVRESYKYPLETWQTNVLGTLNLLESLKSLEKRCAAVLISTDKVYKNNEWLYGYREIDTLGGNDPYSASKAAMELAIDSWRKSFCGTLSHQSRHLHVASARAGNVIGGGDWSKDRLLPDVIKALHNKEVITIRNPKSKRPWQHVLEPLYGYMLLAKKLYEFNNNYTNQELYAEPFNFGPQSNSNKTVEDLLNKILSHWPGKYKINFSKDSFYESGLLNLVSDKSLEMLNWHQKISFEETVSKTVNWYKDYYSGISVIECCLKDINYYEGLIDEF